MLGIIHRNLSVVPRPSFSVQGVKQNIHTLDGITCNSLWEAKHHTSALAEFQTWKEREKEEAT